MFTFQDPCDTIIIGLTALSCITVNYIIDRFFLNVKQNSKR